MLCGSTPVYDDDPLLAWYAIYTRHQHEKTVAHILTNKGFETLLPLYPVTRRWKDRTKLLSLPLFPCYVFLKGGLDRRLDIMTTPGYMPLYRTPAGPPLFRPPKSMPSDELSKAVPASSHTLY
jgi:Transcription termination factor nusG